MGFDKCFRVGGGVASTFAFAELKLEFLYFKQHSQGWKIYEST